MNQDEHYPSKAVEVIEKYSNQVWNFIDRILENNDVIAQRDRDVSYCYKVLEGAGIMSEEANKLIEQRKSMPRDDPDSSHYDH